MMMRVPVVAPALATPGRSWPTRVDPWPTLGYPGIFPGCLRVLTYLKLYVPGDIQNNAAEFLKQMGSVQFSQR